MNEVAVFHVSGLTQLESQVEPPWVEIAVVEFGGSELLQVGVHLVRGTDPHREAEIPNPDLLCKPM